MAKIKFDPYPKPRWRAFRNRESCNCLATNIIGETSRSWVVGPDCRYALISKQEYEVISLDDFNEWYWSVSHFHLIKRAMGEYSPAITPAQLREIARIIGYKEADRG